jgi:signal transduction histidine kinase
MHPDPADRDHTPARSVVRSAVVRFTAFSLVAVLVLTAGTVLAADRIARHRALQDAREQAADIASRLVAPLINKDVRSHRPRALSQLETVMGNRMRDGSLRHVKIWDEQGRIIWADRDDLIGRRYPLTADVAELFGTRDATAELSDLSREENVDERSEGSLVEVYAGELDADGVPVVFEAYLSTQRMEQDARAIVISFVPLVVGALVLFLLIVLPLAVSLSRRVERAQADRSKMMRHALLASDRERRRIAEDLHDGVIQDLAGLGYVLPTATRELHDGGDLDRARATLERVTDLVHRDVTALRSLMTDIYPPDLRGPGLRDAVQQLAQAEAREAGLRVDVVIEPDLDISADAGRLAYRVIREGLRNVVKHARAHRATVELGRHASVVLVRVIDDGDGPGPAPGESPKGHLGLRLLRDTVTDFGGELEVQAPPTGGTTLIARFPAALVPS